MQLTVTKTYTGKHWEKQTNTVHCLLYGIYMLNLKHELNKP